MDTWEYEAYVYDWGSGQLEIRREGRKRGLTWAGMWTHFNELGAQGWEMLSASPVSDARWGNPDSNTTRMLFVFKRRRPEGTSTTERSGGP
jgi:hypothetical protein